MYMAKNVALSNEAYSILEKLKMEKESFSDVVKRMLDEKNSKPLWRDSVGILKDDKEAERIYDKILKERHKTKKRRELKW